MNRLFIPVKKEDLRRNVATLKNTLVMLLCALSLLVFALAKEKVPLTKSIRGHVVDGNKKSLVGVKVFVKNLKQNTTTILVTDQNGLYSVAGLDPKVDFEVHAEYQGMISETKTISSFLNRYDNVLNFELAGQNPVGSRSSSGSTKKPVDLLTADGVKIVGDWYRRSSAKPDQNLPAVLLIHGFGENRTVWDGFIADDLLKGGFAILNIDLRGHGESTSKSGQKLVSDRHWLTDPAQFPLDLDSAIKWLKSQSEIDQNRIGVMGADIGADLAYLASGKYEVVRSAVALSANFAQATALTAGTQNFQPHSILYVAAEADEGAAEDAKKLEKLTGFPVKVRLFENLSSHGSKLLQDAPQAETLVMDWLKNTL